MYQNWRRAWPRRELTSDVMTGNDDALPVSVFAYSDTLERNGRLGKTKLDVQITIEDLFGEILYRDTLEMENDTWNFAVFLAPG